MVQQWRSSGGNGHDASPEFGRGTFAPLGGAGAPPRRFARHLPIERDGGTHFVAVDDVVAIHANAHYTIIFNGNDKLFCPLAIGDVESRLDKSRFVRIHRSHIVNIERVVGYKRSGDNEMVEMDAAHDYAVPVSRSRVGWLKSRVAALTGEDPASPRAGIILHRNRSSCRPSCRLSRNASDILTQFVQARRHWCKSPTSRAPRHALVQRRLLLRRTTRDHR